MPIATISPHATGYAARIYALAPDGARVLVATLVGSTAFLSSYLRPLGLGAVLDGADTPLKVEEHSGVRGAGVTRRQGNRRVHRLLSRE